MTYGTLCRWRLAPTRKEPFPTRGHMSELNYNLFHLRTAENIKVELIKLRESLLKGGQNNAEIHSDVPSIDSLLSDSILDFKDLNPNNNQLKTRKCWHDFLTETSHLSFNECLLILLGVSPKLSNIIEPTLYKTKLNEIKKLQDKQLSLIFFQRVENHLLRERFRSDKINTDDFIKWALDYKYLRKIENESP